MFGMETERLRKAIKIELVYGIKVYLMPDSQLLKFPLYIIHILRTLPALAYSQIMSNGSTLWLS